MADRFATGDDKICEGDGCSKKAVGLYYVRMVQQNQQLCDDCASETDWFCDKHGRRRPIEFYCETHDEGVCHSCATVSHRSTSCDLKDLGDAICEKKQELEALGHKARGRVDLAKKHSQIIAQLKRDVSDHFQAIKKDVDSVINGELNRENEMEQQKVAAINQEADEEIQKINKKREARLRKCQEDAEKRRKPIEDKRRELLDNVNDIADTVQGKIVSMEEETKYILQNLHRNITKIEYLQKDKDLVSNAKRLISSLNDTLHQDLKETAVEQMRGIVQGVRFVEGVRYAKYKGRIDGYSGSWKEDCSFVIPHEVNKPRFWGYISDEEVVVKDRQYNHIHVVNIASMETRKVVHGDINTTYSLFRDLDENTIVCGTQREDATGTNTSIDLYDRQWNLIKSTPIQRRAQNASAGSPVVCVDKDGMILVKVTGTSDIYVISPTDGVREVISIEEKILGFEAMFSGNIFCRKRSSTECIVIDRSGVEQRSITNDEWSVINYTADPLTDTLYVTDWNSEREMYTVYEVSSDGTSRAILEYPLSPRGSFLPLCFITSSGKLLTSDGNKMYIYKKSFAI